MSVPRFTREKIFKRDHGICASCGRDMQRLKCLVDDMREYPGFAVCIRNIDKVFLSIHGDIKTPYWSVHHKQHKSDGGGNLHYNLVTMCNECHKWKHGALPSGYHKPADIKPAKPDACEDSARQVLVDFRCHKCKVQWTISVKSNKDNIPKITSKCPQCGTPMKRQKIKQ